MISYLSHGFSHGFSHLFPGQAAANRMATPGLSRTLRSNSTAALKRTGSFLLGGVVKCRGWEGVEQEMEVWYGDYAMVS